ncbi:GNAT family N-acetyltransferase [Krasilnikovia sp. MM14-A1259]|uniref:GNAT family N-acetyltransferase n=1 Tax=Krasilnikovia sp. MM14-A1259 TaxID=3373539 RepID=UPI00399CF74B
MSEPVTVREATAADWPAVADLVNHYIATTTVNFRTEAQTPQDWTADWTQYRERYPWLVATDAGRVVGVAYAGPWKARDAYDWCAEVTGYVADDMRGRRVGHALYRSLLAVLDAQGFRTQIAVLGLPNDPSAGFHESFGFRHVGTLAGVGFKNATWLDVGFWQRSAAATGQAPGPLLPCAEVLKDVLDGIGRNGTGT